MKLIKSFFMLVGGGITLIILLGVIGTMMQSPDTSTPREQRVATAKSTTTQSEAAPKKVESPADRLTGAQKNAARSAKNYLSFSGFSRDGLIGQLSSDAGDGYAVADATAAVDSLNVDWNEQAVRSAKNYLNLMGFSCKGLIQQLSSQAGDKYTTDQATYGAKQAGACG